MNLNDWGKPWGWASSRWVLEGWRRAQQLLRTDKRRTQRQGVLRSLRPSTASIGVEVDLASDLFLSIGTTVPKQQLEVDFWSDEPGA